MQGGKEVVRFANVWHRGFLREGERQSNARFLYSVNNGSIHVNSLSCGIIAMIFPKIFNYLSGIYLIIIGVRAPVAYVA